MEQLNTDQVRFQTRGAKKMGWKFTDALTLTLDGPNSFFYKGQSGDVHKKNPERVAAFEKLDPSIRDAIIVAKLAGSYKESPNNTWPSDWEMRNITPDNRKEAYETLVNMRLKSDKGLPTWLYFVCRAYVKNEWYIPEDWITILRAAVTLAEDHGLPAYFPDEARDWLRKWDHRPGLTL